MGKGNVDDTERDPALFPESRVRPWVVDEEAERKLQRLLDDLEKTLNFVSPVKVGLGESLLDRTLLCDNGGEIFYKELAAVDAKEKSKAARAASGTCSVPNLSEIFGNLYRKTRGLSARRPTTAGGMLGEDRARSHEQPGASEPDTVVAAKAAGKEGEIRDPNDGDELAADPEVARLLTQLQAELDADSSNTAEAGEGGGEDGEGRGEGEQEDEGGEESANEDAESDDEARHSDALPDSTKSEAIDPPQTRGGKQQQQQLPVPAESATTVGELQSKLNQHPRAGHEGERIDISRMKIDAPHNHQHQHHRHHWRGGARPRSAPSSACLSAGGLSRLSSRASSSSYLGRAVTQKLLQATKEVEKQRAVALAEAQGLDQTKEAAAALLRRSGTPASAVAQAEGRIHFVKKRAEALQAGMSVKRTSYLNGRQPRPARRSPPPVSRARPKTAAPVGCRRQERDSASNGNGGRAEKTPILSRRETEFLFGAGAEAGSAAAAEGEEGDSPRTPSLRKVTLGRMLQHSSGTSSMGHLTDRTSPSSLSESSSATYLHYRRPPSASGQDVSDGRRRTKRWLEVSNNVSKPSSWKPDTRAPMRVGDVTAAPATKACIRPSSAAPGSGRGWVERPSSIAASGDQRHAERKRSNEDCAFRDHDQSGGGISLTKKPIARSPGSPADRGETAARACKARPRLSARGAPDAVARKWAGRQSRMSVRQALEATIKATLGEVSPLEQFVQGRKTIAEMKRINTKDSTGDMLLSTQGMSKARIAEECWSSETGREYR